MGKPHTEILGLQHRDVPSIGKCPVCGGATAALVGSLSMVAEMRTNSYESLRTAPPSLGAGQPGSAGPLDMLLRWLVAVNY